VTCWVLPVTESCKYKGHKRQIKELIHSPKSSSSVATIADRLPIIQAYASHDQWSVTWLVDVGSSWCRIDCLSLLIQGIPDVSSEFLTSNFRIWIWPIEFEQLEYILLDIFLIRILGSEFELSNETLSNETLKNIEKYKWKRVIENLKSRIQRLKFQIHNFNAKKFSAINSMAFKFQKLKVTH